MISEPYEDITKACEDAEANAAKRQLDHAVVMVRDVVPEDNRYHILLVVDLDELREDKLLPQPHVGWQLMAIAKPSGLVYTWKPVPGYDKEAQL